MAESEWVHDRQHQEHVLASGHSCLDVVLGYRGLGRQPCIGISAIIALSNPNPNPNPPPCPSLPEVLSRASCIEP